MKEGSPVTQEFSIERKKMINDSFVFRARVEEFSSQIQTGYSHTSPNVEIVYYATSQRTIVWTVNWV